MATADRHIGDLNVELTKGQGRSIKLTSLLTATSTTVGQWSAVSGPNGSQAPTCTADSGSLLVSWSDGQATASIGRSWRLRLDGDDVAGGRVVEARPQATPGTASVAIQVDPLSEVTTTVVVTPAGPAGATGATGATGPAGADGADAVYSDATPAALGVAAPGTADLAAREGHVHPMPTAVDVGALPGSDAGFLPGERNYGDWLVGTTYPVGAVVHDHDGDGNVYVATVANVGAQPSITPGSWDVVDPVTRGGVSSGPGAVAGIQGAAQGFAAEAGPSAVAFGYASRAGAGGFAIGALASAGDHAVAIGQGADASGDGDVVIGSGPGLLTGTIDYNTAEVTAAALPGGFVDLPETTIATDPATGARRIVNRAAGLYVRDDTGAETALGGGGGGGGGVSAVVDSTAFGTSTRLIASTLETGASSAHALAALGREMWAPVWVPAGTYDAIGVRSTVAAVSTWRLGLDAQAADGWPGAIIVDAGTVDMNATAGWQVITGLSVVVTADKWLWFHLKVVAYTATPQVWVPAAAPLIPGWPMGGGGRNNGLYSTLNAGSSGVLTTPGPFGSPSTGPQPATVGVVAALRRSA